MNTLRTFFYRSWRPAVAVLSLILLAYLLYFHRLNSLVPGYSTPEIQTYAAAQSWHSIAQNPVDGPYKALLWLLTAVLHHGVLTTRVISAAFGVVAVPVFFMVIKPWFSFRTAFLGTVLFATSAGFLHFARLGTAQILEMGVLVFLGAILWYRRTQRHKGMIGYAVVLLCALLCYIPGLLWFELLGFGLLYHSIRRRIGQTSSVHVTGYSLIFLIVLAPLIIAGARDSHVLISAAGLPTDTHQLSHFVTNLWHGLSAIGLRSDGNALLWVGHTPLLNIVEFVLFALGLYYYVFLERSTRTTYMVGAIVISLLLIGFGSNTGLAALIPLVYLFVVSGLNQLTEQWLRVFPRNPFARFTGIALIIGMLFFSVLYQVRSYFVAWPHTPATKMTFDRRVDS